MVHTDGFNVSSVSSAHSRWITLSGELDLASAPRLGDELARAIACPTRAVVLDLSGLTFMDCAGLRAVVNFSDRARARGWRLKVVSPPPRIARLFSLDDSGSTLRLGGSEIRQPEGSPARPALRLVAH